MADVVTKSYEYSVELDEGVYAPVNRLSGGELRYHYCTYCKSKENGYPDKELAFVGTTVENLHFSFDCTADQLKPWGDWIKCIENEKSPEPRNITLKFQYKVNGALTNEFSWTYVNAVPVSWLMEGFDVLGVATMGTVTLDVAFDFIQMSKLGWEEKESE